MSEKRAKEIRKAEKMIRELTKRLQPERARKDVPIAGCSRCDSAAWYIELDDYPPKARFIKAFICITCEAMIETEIDMHLVRGREEVPPEPEDSNQIIHNQEIGEDTYE